MLLLSLGTALAGLLCLLVAKQHGRRFYSVLWLEHRFNVMGARDVLTSWIRARHNKTELPLMPGRVAIVTGGSRGIGTEIVRMLLQCDMKVVIACRNPFAGVKTIKAIRSSGVDTGDAKIIQLDNSSLESVKQFVTDFQNNYNSLDILINNAGVMFPPYNETKDGFEEQYSVNYLSHFLLTVLLIPQLKLAGTPERYSRVVNVSSCAHLLGKIKLDNINNKDNFITGEAYAQSKLAQVLSTKKLSRLFKDNKVPIKIHAVHPGIVDTDLFENSLLVRFMRPITKFIFKTPAQGATSILFAALSPKIEEKSGLYISNCLETSINPLAHNETLQDQHFELTLEQVGLQTVTI